jgi:putative transposase
MARQKRLALAGRLHYVVQRGHAGAKVFADQADTAAFKSLLLESARVHDVAVHAYALTLRQIELLLTPKTDGGLSLLMQSLGRRYVMAFNRRHGTSGTLWEGRFRAAVIEPDTYLIAAMVQIESQGPRGGGSAAEAGCTTSAAHHLGQATDPLIVDHDLFWRLGNTPFEREQVYREALLCGLTPQDSAMLTSASLKGWVLGSPEFVARLSGQTDRPLLPRPRGRPRKLASGAADKFPPKA